jgi:hypothetical protein
MAKECNNVGSICLLLFFAAIILIIIYFYNSRRCVKNTGSLGASPLYTEPMENIGGEEDLHAVQYQPPQAVGDQSTQQPVQNKLNVQHGQTPPRPGNKPAGCFPKEQLNPEELLPQDNANVWAQANPEGEGSLKDRNFLQAGHHIGVNTVGQTLRNANMQLRSEPPNPQVKVSPWLQTTIEPDVNRKPMEIGGCA